MPAARPSPAPEVRRHIRVPRRRAPAWPGRTTNRSARRCPGPERCPRRPERAAERRGCRPAPIRRGRPAGRHGCRRRAAPRGSRHRAARRRADRRAGPRRSRRAARRRHDGRHRSRRPSRARRPDRPAPGSGPGIGAPGGRAGLMAPPVAPGRGPRVRCPVPAPVETAWVSTAWISVVRPVTLAGPGRLIVWRLIAIWKS